MWPFRRKEQKSGVKKNVERLVTGFVIGAAISSIVGKKLMDHHEEEYCKDNGDEGGQDDTKKDDA